MGSSSNPLNHVMVAPLRVVFLELLGSGFQDSSGKWSLPKVMVSSSLASVLIRMVTATPVVIGSGVFCVPSSSSVSVVPVVVIIAVTLAIRILVAVWSHGMGPVVGTTVVTVCVHDGVGSGAVLSGLA
ncbi:hypothetical protein A2U01_0035697 [Trifolium medium]|uniref:Uncharacterized protein n=1 Tax=Trifolium medium TaxID=97028 RepID=A0A392PUG7_9FABA|nr:hypothetical protein [Trifolium medium]